MIDFNRKSLSRVDRSRGKKTQIDEDIVALFTHDIKKNI